MIYMIATIIEIVQNKLVIESNKTGYCGFYIFDSYPELNQEIYIYVLRVQNEYTDEYIFFEKRNTRNLAKLLLTIKNFGIKSLIDLFTNISYDQLIKYCKENKFNELFLDTKLNQDLCRKIINLIKSKILNIKYNKTQLLVIDSLYRLGYKLPHIYNAISQIDEKTNEEKIIKKTLIYLNETNNEL